MCWLSENAFKNSFKRIKKVLTLKTERTDDEKIFVSLKALHFHLPDGLYCNATDNVNHTFDVFISARMKRKWWQREKNTISKNWNHKHSHTHTHTKKQPFHANIIVLRQRQCQQWMISIWSGTYITKVHGVGCWRIFSIIKVFEVIKNGWRDNVGWKEMLGK